MVARRRTACGETRVILGPVPREGTLYGADIPGQDARVIVILWQGSLRAYFDRCPHYDFQTGMAWKRDAYLDGTGTRLACHAHGAQFDISTGECVQGPCLGQSLLPAPVEAIDGQVVLTGPLPKTG